ncbi:DNA-binding transcription factor yap1 [Coemansia biformis]|uniref:DNA-binding transcription factor yap1 n=1 Tax=Coemansia biformis TaxID=1286918 RepID=A0A9W7Y7H9_9FUNG|nr:DNA-binding transcription factor yap1 [Coemansia biformis]
MRLPHVLMLGGSDESHDDKKPKKPGRKPITTTAPSKRTAQNRAAQRAFRDRKQQHLKGLEEKVKELTEQHERTERENQQLKQHIDALRAENTTLKSGKFTYENPPVDFDSAINEFLETSHSPGLDLSSVFDQPPASGASTTKSGDANAAHAQWAVARESSSSASPQNVPVLYPGVDLASATSGSLANSLLQQSSTSVLAGQNSLLSTAPSSLVTGFSSDIVSSLQMLASSQNLSTGPFVGQLLDGSTSSTAPVVSTSVFDDSLPSLATPDNNVGHSPASTMNAVTPGDMFAPLGHQSIGGGGSGFFGADAFKDPGYLASFASLIRQATGSDGGVQALRTPSLSELLAMSPSQASGSPTGLALSPGTGTTASLPPGSSLVAANLATSSGGSSVPDLPPYLMAYRNPDPFSIGDDGDRLEKLLLSSMYPTTSSTGDAPAGALPPQQQHISSSDLASLVAQIPTVAQQPATTSSAGSDSTLSHAPTAAKEVPLIPLCTCRDSSLSPCEPCPKHGSPADLSGELRDMAPQMLDYVCSTTNCLADDELNDLCSLMYKHAKCSDMQRRVEAARSQLKVEADLELLHTKQRLAKQYGLE